VWLIILGSIIVVGLLLWFVTEGTGDWAPILYPYTNRNEQTIMQYLWDTGFALTSQSGLRVIFLGITQCGCGTIWHLWISFLYLTGNKMRLNESSRVLLGVWWTYCIILIYTYNGTLIASLTVPRLAKIFQNLEELANQREVLWTYRANTAHEKLFSVII